MAYTNDDKIARLHVINKDLSANLAESDSTFAVKGTISVSGNFTATVILESKTYGDSDNEGDWVEQGVITEPGSYNFYAYTSRPWRYRVTDYQAGSLSVYMEREQDTF